MKKTYYAIYQSGKIAHFITKGGVKMPLILISERQAKKVAAHRTLKHKRTNVIKKITIGNF